MKRSFGTLTGNTTITVTLSNDQDIELLLIQGGTGSYTVSWVNVDKWLTPAGTAPVLKTAVGASDMIQLSKTGGLVYGIHVGESGAAGAAGSTGPAGLNWRRAYSAGNSYTSGPPADAVYLNGSSYIALQDSSSTNVQQPDLAPTYWGLLAAAGSGSGGSSSSDSIDTFVRADNANISTNAPFAYTVDAGTFSIASNTCAISTTTHGYVRATGAVPTSADQHAQVTISTYTPNSSDNLQIGVTCRSVSSTSTRYEAEVKCVGVGSHQLRLHSLVSGTDNILGTFGLSGTPVAGDTIKLNCAGTTISVLYNGVTRISVTDTAVDGTTVGGKQCGFHMLEATASVQAAISEFRFGA